MKSPSGESCTQVMDGRIPIRTELEVLPAKGSSFGQQEWAEHGSIALRLYGVSPEDPLDNRLDGRWKLTRGCLVLVRGAAGGFWVVPLQWGPLRKWYVTCGKEIVPVVFDSKRSLWVATRLV